MRMRRLLVSVVVGLAVLPGGRVGLAQTKTFTTDADFDGMIHTASCPQTATSVAFTFDYKLKTH